MEDGSESVIQAFEVLHTRPHANGWSPPASLFNQIFLLRTRSLAQEIIADLKLELSLAGMVAFRAEAKAAEFQQRCSMADKEAAKTSRVSTPTNQPYSTHTPVSM